MPEDQPVHLNVALYCRVSTEEQREGQTIDSQIAELERFVHDKQWTVSGVYKDEGWSGSLLDRPALDQLRDHASQGRFQAVLVNDVDRLARDVSHLGILKRDLESRMVRLIFRKLPGEQSPTHNLLVNILGSFAEFERELIADRTRRGRRHKVEVRKQHIGSIPPYGFRYIAKRSTDGEPGHLEILPAEAAIVRQMYEWVDQDGLSAQKVVARLNEIGVRPRKGGQRWQKSSVLRILRSEVYSGVWYYNKHLHAIPIHPPTNKYRKSLRTSSRLRARAEWIPVSLPEELRIVDVAPWRRVQQQLDRNVALSPRNSKHNYLLRGLVRCGGCGGSYVGDPDSHGFSYRCMNRCKRYPSIRETSLNLTVWNAVKRSLKAPEIVISGIKAIEQNKRSDLTSERARDQKALDQIQVEEMRILEAYRIGFITADQLGSEIKGLKARRSLIQSHMHEREGKANIAAAQRSIRDFCKSISDRLDVASWEIRRQILLHLITKITFEGEIVRISGRISLPSDTSHVSSIVRDNPDGHGGGHVNETDSARALSSGHLQEDYKIDNTGSLSHRSGPDGIADTMLGNDGRNPGRIAGTTPWNDGRNSNESTVIFELKTRLCRDQTVALAARKANLLKANAVRSKGRIQ